jgi:hypothetical protein
VHHDCWQLAGTSTGTISEARLGFNAEHASPRARHLGKVGEQVPGAAAKFGDTIAWSQLRKANETLPEYALAVRHSAPF